jgi:hypothetical protein
VSIRNEFAVLLDIAEKLATLADTLSDTLSLPRRVHERPLRVAIIRSHARPQYHTDQNSPYRAIRENTRRGYDDCCRTLDRAIGKRRIDHLSGQDIRNCFLRLMEPVTPGGVPRLRLATACVRSMLSILVPSQNLVQPGNVSELCRLGIGSA